MRLIFLLLVLANAVFFAYWHYGMEQTPTQAVLRALEVAPDKVRVIPPAVVPDPQKTPVTPPPAPVPQATPAAPAPTSATVTSAACVEWGIFAGPDVARAEAALGALGLAAGSIRSAVVENVGYWVYMPPHRTRQEIDRKLAELKGLGIAEVYVVQEPVQWRNAISLGIFRAEDAAQAYLASLRARGVRSAIVGKREDLLRHVAFYLRDPGAPVVARMAELQKQFPGSEIRAAACPA